MITTVQCERCEKLISADEAERYAVGIGDFSCIVHIPGHDGDYAKEFAYFDLCPQCTKDFHRFMKGEKEDA